MDFPGRAETSIELETHDGTDGFGIFLRPSQRHAHTGRTTPISEKFGRPAMLGDDQIHSAIPIKIGHRAAALFPVNGNACFARSQGAEPALPIAKQYQSHSGIVSG